MAGLLRGQGRRLISVDDTLGLLEDLLEDIPPFHIIGIESSASVEYRNILDEYFGFCGA